MPQFDLSSLSSQFFWLVTVFAFLYLVVSYFIAPKAESILSARNRYIEDNIRYAQEYNDKVKSINMIKRERLSEVNALVEDMQKQAMDLLEEHFNKQQKELSEILAKKLDKAKKDIDNYTDQFHIDELEPSINLAAYIIQKITNKPADLELLKKIYETR